MSDYRDPACLWRCLLWAAITAMFLLVAFAPLWATACDYTPDPVSVPPRIVAVAV